MHQAHKNGLVIYQIYVGYIWVEVNDTDLAVIWLIIAMP